MISPMHGLEVRYWRWERSPLRPVGGCGSFNSTLEVNWGPAPGSGQDTLGTFSEVVLPSFRKCWLRNLKDTATTARFGYL
jgi:hypothetical protein